MAAINDWQVKKSHTGDDELDDTPWYSWYLVWEALDDDDDDS